MADSEYDRDLRIDIDDLEIEWMRQPRLYMKYSEKYEKAEQDCRAAKEKMEYEYAKAFSEIVGEFDKKPSDSLIDSKIHLQADYIRAVDDYDSALYKSRMLSAAVKAFDQKKAALENLVKLFLGQYFSGPKEPRDSAGVKMRESALDKLADNQQEAISRRNQKRREE